MKFIKTHKFTTFIIIIFIVGVIAMNYLFNLFFTNSGRPEYGNRLNGIENVEISEKLISDIEASIKKNSSVKVVDRKSVV